MSMTATGTIVNITSKQVNTKYGVKPVYAIEMSDGQTYDHGFKKVTALPGTQVSFAYETNKYGKNVIEPGTMTAGNTAAVPTLPTSTTIAPPRPNNYGAKTFPVPKLHGDRSIIRQNALTQARELFMFHAMADEDNKGLLFFGNKLATPEEAVDAVINLAYRFESYAAGDIEAAALSGLTGSDTANG